MQTFPWNGCHSFGTSSRCSIIISLPFWSVVFISLQNSLIQSIEMCLLLCLFAFFLGCQRISVVFQRIYRGRLKRIQHYFEEEGEHEKEVCNENGVSSFYVDIEKLLHDVSIDELERQRKRQHLYWHLSSVPHNFRWWSFPMLFIKRSN